MPFAIRPLPGTLHARRGALPAIGIALLLGACGSDPALNGGFGNPFSASRNTVSIESLTVQRVRGSAPEVTPLAAEDGNVWPAQETPRPTLLGGPDEAMRNIPEYRPSLIEGAPAARSPASGPPGRGLPGSSTSPQPSIPLREPPRATVLPPTQPVTPPSADRRILTDPSGRPVIGTGDAGRVQGFQQPGGGSGAVIRDGNVETFIGPDGQARTRIAPR